MPINTYSDTSAADYLEKQRIELAKQRAANLSNRSLTPSYILPISDTLAIADTVAAPTSGTPNSYELTEDTTNQKLFLLLNQDLLDGSWNGNNGTVSGTETYAAGPEISPDKLLYAFDFDGSTQITTPDETEFDFERTAEWTISFFAKWTSASIMQIVTKMTATTNTGFEIGVTAAGKIRIRLINTATTNEIDVITTAVYFDGVWRHFCITKSTASNAAGLKLYVNGSNVTLNTTTDNLSATMLNNIDLNIGGYDDATGDFIGQVCDVQVWNLEFSAAESLLLSQGKQHSEHADPQAILSLSDVSA